MIIDDNWDGWSLKKEQKTGPDYLVLTTPEIGLRLEAQFNKLLEKPDTVLEEVYEKKLQIKITLVT